MGQAKIITPQQESLLAKFRQNEFLLTNFYFSGGTALSLHYLQHRKSIDPFILGSDLLKVEEFDYLPEMIKPLTLEKLKSFFREKAKKISGQSLK